MPGRSVNPERSRFTFQNQEQDREWLGGNAIAYKYRFHDPRLGRFLSVDPLMGKYPYNSTYAFSENRLIDGLEIEGLEVRVFSQHLGMSFSNSVSGAFGGRHMVMRVTTPERDVIIELWGVKGGLTGQPRVDEYTSGNIENRMDVVELVVIRPKGVPDDDYSFENKIIEYAEQFTNASVEGEVYDQWGNREVLENPLLPVYDKMGPNSNGYIEALIKRAGGDLVVVFIDAVGCG